MPTAREKPVIAIAIRGLCIWGMCILAVMTVAPWSISAAEKEIRGRAVVLSGNLISIKNRTVRLFAIEAPRREQTCRIY